jgi:hypothetical protein
MRGSAIAMATLLLLVSARAQAVQALLAPREHADAGVLALVSFPAPRELRVVAALRVVAGPGDITLGAPWWANEVVHRLRICDWSSSVSSRACPNPKASKRSAHGLLGIREQLQGSPSMRSDNETANRDSVRLVAIRGAVPPGIARRPRLRLRCSLVFALRPLSCSRLPRTCVAIMMIV